MAKVDKRILLLCVVGLLIVLPDVLGRTCEDISGRWYNQLGSEVKIDHLTDGRLFGKYYTAVSLARDNVIGHDLIGK